MEESKILGKKIRYYIIDMIRNCGYGHIGGSLSIADLLAVIYSKYMKINPEDPMWDDRDYFVLSKGHAGPALYATLSLVGFFEKDLLYTLNKLGTILPSHPDRLKTPGVDTTTGCLGQGPSISTGIALGLKLKSKSQKVFCIVGDGELNEGQNYEALQTIIHHKLNNLITIVDYNQYQLDGPIKDICDPQSYEERFKGFGFQVFSVDGHDHIKIAKTISAAIKSPIPTIIIAETVKGKGFKRIEEQHIHHDKVNSPEILASYEEILVEYAPFLDLGVNSYV